MQGATGPNGTPRIVLAEYFLSDERALVFGTTADSPEADLVTVPFSRAEVRALAERVRAELGGGRPALGALLREELLVRLVAPVTRWARPGDLVYLVPHDVLHRLPLHAVPVDGGIPLSRRNPVVVTPSASVLQYCLAKKTERRRDSALIVADPPSARPLVFAREQARAIAAGLGPTRVLVGGSASRAELVAALAAKDAAPGILHFSAHGVFDPDEPMRSGIELADGRLTAQDILGMTLDVDLVTLGACETGVSDRRPGDELIGLTRALLYAGAPSALVTLWRVDELSTSMLLRDFYAALAGGTSKAESLRQAQALLSERTLADVLAHARESRERLGDDPAAAATLAREEARMLARSGDGDAALRLLADTLRTPGLDGADQELLRVAQKRIMLAAPTANAASPADAAPVADAGPGSRVFADPYYWAPFVLVGDWY
ncbi:CHAT domain-containing protein [Nonomuraea angiospora]|uniref:CHAT domain-containing protein n=1 Tax=Nonomuraea angiospora TaxID=46172 RepID=UPI0033D9360C